MIQLVEMTGYVNERGCIEVPVELFDRTGIHTEEEVKLLYIAAGEKDYRNEAREFILAKKSEQPGEDIVKEENISLKLPPELLGDAGIPLTADLDIVCMERKIVILPAEDVEAEVLPKELLDICEDLGISKEKVNIILHTMEEGNEEAGV